MADPLQNPNPGTANPPTIPPVANTQGSDPGSLFGQAIMNMLQQYQGINRTPFLAGQLGAQQQAAQSVAYNDPNLAGASPSQQDQARQANTAPLSQAAQNFYNAQSTFSGKLQQFESILDMANQFGQQYIQVNPGPATIQGYVDALRKGAMTLNQIPVATLPAIMKAVVSDPTIIEDYKNAQPPKVVKTGTDVLGNPIYSTIVWDSISGTYVLGTPQRGPAGSSGASGTSGATSASGGATGTSGATGKNDVIYPEHPPVQLQPGQIPTFDQAEAQASGSRLPNQIMEKSAYDLAYGNVPPPTSTIPRSAKTAQYQSMITQRAEQLNPNFNAADAAGQYKYATDDATKTKVQAINAVLPNMDAIIALSDAFQRSDFPTVNGLLRSYGWLTGDQTVSSLNQASKVIGDELGIALGGGNMTDMKLQLGLDLTVPVTSVDNFKNNMNMLKKFLNNRLQSIAQQAGPYAKGELGINPQPTTTKSGQPFDYQAAKSAGYTDQEIQDYINTN